MKQTSNTGTIVLAIFLGLVGAIVYSASRGFSGLWFGMLLASVVAVAIITSRRLDALELRISELKSRLGGDELPAEMEAASKPEVPEVAEPTQPSPAVPPFPTVTQTTTTIADESPLPIEPALQAIQPSALASKTDEVLEAAKRFLLGGNTAVRAGVIILFFGVAFLLKYAAEHGKFPIELRFIVTAFGGIAMLAIGWRLRFRRMGYSLALQGGGIGVLYLTVFAALRLYGLIPPTGAFAILVAASALAGALSVLQNSRSLALLGVVGGFLAPVLASTGGGNHVALFSYYAILNAGILGVAWFKAWRILNVTGFVFTFVIGAMWGYRYYQPQFLATTEPFLILFFLLYVCIAILFALRQAPDLKGYIDGTIVFGTPIVAFSLQSYLVQGYEYGLAWSALGVGAFYLFLAWVLFLKGLPTLRMLIEAFLALGVVFLTLAIPMAFDGRWTAAAWAFEGAAIVWIGVRQHRLLARVFGVLVQVGAGAAFLVDAAFATKAPAVLNGFYIGRILISGAALFTAYYLYRWKEKTEGWEQIVSHALLVLGLVWWFGAGLYEIERHIVSDYQIMSSLLFVTLSGAACHYLSRRFSWTELGYPAIGILPVMYLVVLISAQTVKHPLGFGGYVAWPAAFTVHYWILRQYEQHRTTDELLRYGHAAAMWLLAIIGSWEVFWGIDRLIQGAGTWSLIAWALVPALLVLSVSVGWRSLAWPLGRYRDDYLSLGVVPIAIFLIGWSVFSSLTSRGDPWPLPYLPLLNPLDISQAFVLIVAIIWFQQIRKLRLALFDIPINAVYTTLAATVFLWLNAVLIRTLHHWGGVEFSLPGIFDSVLAQSALSIFWALLALTTMLLATRLKERVVWIVGAGLLGLVVAKLFLVDLANSGTVERVVSFLGVGVLLLVVGYFSPVPPRVQLGEGAR